LALRVKERSYLTTKGSFKVSQAGTLALTTLKVHSSALEIKAEAIIKCNALDSKAREIIRVKTSKGATLRPTRGLVDIHRIVKMAPVTRRPETMHLSNPMVASSAVS
jgi:cystathionine beta-lyase family protein involved in aluminum resistance